MEPEIKIGDFVKTSIGGIIMQVYELSSYQGEVRATGKFHGTKRMKMLTYPVDKLTLIDAESYPDRFLHQH